MEEEEAWLSGRPNIIFLFPGDVTDHDAEQRQYEHGEKDSEAVGVQQSAGRQPRLVLGG